MSALHTLADSLGVPVEEVSYLEGYAAEKLARLQQLVVSASEAEAATVERSLLDGLEHVPRPLRRTARSLLVPEARR